MKNSGWKKHGELASWDLDPSSRQFVNQSTKAHRKLKKKLLRIGKRKFYRATQDE